MNPAHAHCPQCGQSVGEVLPFRNVDRIVKVVCALYGVTSAQMMSKDRHRTIAEARAVAMYLVRCMTGASFPEIGRHFADRDHTTVMSACKKAATTIDARMLECLRVAVDRLAEVVKVEAGAQHVEAIAS